MYSMYSPGTSHMKVPVVLNISISMFPLKYFTLGNLSTVFIFTVEDAAHDVIATEIETIKFEFIDN